MTRGAKHYGPRPAGNPGRAVLTREDAAPTKKYPNRPPREVLAAKCLTHTVGDIAADHGVAHSTAYDWLWAHGLEALPGRRQQPARMPDWAEIEVSATWIRRALGSPWGGAGWYSNGTLHAMRAGE